MMPSNYLILCHPLLLFPSIFPILACVKVIQSCPILCDPMDYTVHGEMTATVQ